VVPGVKNKLIPEKERPGQKARSFFLSKSIKHDCRNAVARETPRCIPGWRSQRECQNMLSSEAAFQRSREQGSKTQL